MHVRLIWLQLFEISDVVLKDDTADVGARNERRLCVLYYGQTSGLEVYTCSLHEKLCALRVSYTRLLVVSVSH